MSQIRRPAPYRGGFWLQRASPADPRSLITLLVSNPPPRSLQGGFLVTTGLPGRPKELNYPPCLKSAAQIRECPNRMQNQVGRQGRKSTNATLDLHSCLSIPPWRSLITLLVLNPPPRPLQGGFLVTTGPPGRPKELNYPPCLKSAAPLPTGGVSGYNGPPRQTQGA